MFSILFVDFMREERTYDNEKPPVEVYLFHFMDVAAGCFCSFVFGLPDYIKSRRERK